MAPKCVVAQPVFVLEDEMPRKAGQRDRHVIDREEAVKKYLRSNPRSRASEIIKGVSPHFFGEIPTAGVKKLMLKWRKKGWIIDEIIDEQHFYTYNGP